MAIAKTKSGVGDATLNGSGRRTLGELPSDREPAIPEPAGVAKRSPIPEALIGLLLMVLAAGGILAAFMSATASDPVLVLNRPVAAGELLEREMFDPVGLSSDAVVDGLPPEAGPSLIGRAPAVDLPAGHQLTEAVLLPVDRIGPGRATVGLSLKAGDYPAGIRVGDIVQGVVVPRPEDFNVELPPVLIGSPAEVFAVEVVANTQGSVVITLVMPEAEAEGMSTAHSVDRVRLVELGG